MTNIVFLYNYSQGGVKLRSFGRRGIKEGEFNNPRGVAVDEKDNILVTDYKNNRIQKFTSDGEFLAAVGTKGNKPLQFKGPKAIAFNTFNKKVYVGDNNCVQILNSDLSLRLRSGVCLHSGGRCSLLV